MLSRAGDEEMLQSKRKIRIESNTVLHSDNHNFNSRDIGLLGNSIPFVCYFCACASVCVCACACRRLSNLKNSNIFLFCAEHNMRYDQHTICVDVENFSTNSAHLESLPSRIRRKSIRL